MSAMKVRKNNVGRAIIRFLIGAIILAVLVLVFQQFVLKKKIDTTTSPEGTKPLEQEIVNNEVKPGDEFEEPVDDIFDDGWNFADEGDGTDEVADPGFDDEFTYPEDDEFDLSGDDEFDLPGDEQEEEPAVVTTPTPEPTPEPTATPVPTPTPVSAAAYSTPYAKARNYPWKTDRDTRVKNGITELTIGMSENGGNVISLTAFCYGNWEGFNGKDCTTYVEVKDQKKNAQYYPVTVEPGITGITHTLKRGKNLEYADFTCVIDVSKYPDGTYSLGSCVRFKVSGNTYSFGYTFGDSYEFTVVGGYITAMGGVEN